MYLALGILLLFGAVMHLYLITIAGLLFFGAVIIYKIITKKDRKDYLKKFKRLSYAFIILSIVLLGYLLLFRHVVSDPTPSLAYIKADSSLAESIENHLKFEFPDKVESDVTLIYYTGHDGSSSFGQAEGYEISFELTPESFVEFENKFKGEYRHYETVALENNNILVTMDTYPFIYPSYEEVPDRSVGLRQLIFPASHESIPREQIQEVVSTQEYLKYANLD